ASHLGDGTGWGLSPDGKWALATLDEPGSAPPRLMLFPIGPGESRTIPTKLSIERAAWMPDGQHVAVIAHAPNRTSRVYVLDLSGGEPRAITPEGLVGTRISHDGR